MTPGQNQKHYLARALDPVTGTLHHCLRSGKTNALFRGLVGHLEVNYPAEQCPRVYMVVDNYKIHRSKAVKR
jgi:hypothetical protein